MSGQFGNRPTEQAQLQTLAPLARPIMAILNNLDEAGGAGDLDQYGRVVVGPTRHPLPGGATEWLMLVARGYVAGERGRIIMTEQGRKAAAKLRAGLVKEAS